MNFFVFMMCVFAVLILLFIAAIAIFFIWLRRIWRRTPPDQSVRRGLIVAFGLAAILSPFVGMTSAMLAWFPYMWASADMEFVSPSIATIYGTEPDALLGDIKYWAAMVLPEDRETAGHHIEQACHGQHVEVFRCRGDPETGSPRAPLHR